MLAVVVVQEAAFQQRVFGARARQEADDGSLLATVL